VTTPTPAEATPETPIYQAVLQDDDYATKRYMITVDEGWRPSILGKDMYGWAATWLGSSLRAQDLDFGHPVAAERGNRDMCGEPTADGLNDRPHAVCELARGHEWHRGNGFRWLAVSEMPPGSLDLDAIQARADAATDGPWTTYVAGAGIWSSAPYGWVLRSDEGPILFGPLADIEFAAHARTDVPALVAEVRRLRALEDRLAASTWTPTEPVPTTPKRTET
jgi:hypothetical protein